MYVIVGLGNPGIKYNHTRHNMGFDALDFLASKNGIDIKKVGYKSTYGEGFIKGKKVVLVKPQTFMNLSGQSVVMLLSWYKIEQATELIVLYDDTDLDIGSIRLRAKGSAGTHNGMKSIIGLTGSDEFLRVRIGIGKRPDNWDMADYVLSVIPDDQKEDVKKSLLDACDAVELMINDEFILAQRKYNKKAKKVEVLENSDTKDIKD